MARYSSLETIKQLIRQHPFIFTGLFLLVFATVILIIAAIFLNQPGNQVSTELTDSQKAYKEAVSYSNDHPIVEKLPIIYADYDAQYNYTEYRIDGGEFKDCKTNFCLKVTDTTGNNLNAAKQKIREAGFNPDDFQILYEYKPIKAL